MSTTNIDHTEVMTELRAKQQQVWSSGDYNRIAALTVAVNETLVTSAQVAPGEDVLDVATGTGHSALAAARVGARVTGIDYVPELLDIGRQRAAAERLDVEFVEAAAEQLPFADGSFDAAHCERVTEVVAELESPPNESVAESENLPALTESATDEKRSLIPALPDVAGAAVRWMRPFVPPVVASAIETTTRPLRAARQVYEETEEIHFSLRRSHRVSVTEETAEPDEQWIDATPATQIKKTKTTRIDRPKPQARTEIHTSGGRRQLPSADS